VAQLAQPGREADGQLGVGKEPHPAPSSATAWPPAVSGANSRAASRSSRSIGIVGEDLLHRHPRSKQLQQHLDGVPQSTDNRLAVADRRVGGNPVESRHASSLPSERLERSLPIATRVIPPPAGARNRVQGVRDGFRPGCPTWKGRLGPRTTLRSRAQTVPRRPVVSDGHKERSAQLMILPKVRDPRFVTIRRGGTLTDSDHHLLALWAASCAGHVLHLFESAQPEDSRPHEAIEHARAWARGEVKMMQARAAGGHAMGAARPLRGAARNAAYAAGQAGAVAHVAAHELGAAAYAIKAARAAAPEGEGEAAGRLECQWQRDRLPEAIRELVVDDQRLRNDICWSVFDC